MTNRELREMENRIRQAEEAPYDPSDERIEEIKQRAFEEYQRYTQAHEKANEKKEKQAQRKRSILRRVVVVTAVAVCFFVLSIVYIALQPSITANADGIFRQAIIWINDQLHLGIVITNPVEVDEPLSPGEHRFYSSIQEVKDAGYRPIISLPESDDWHIDQIDLFQQSRLLQQLSIRYIGLNEEVITIRIDPLFDINTIETNDTVTRKLKTSLGEFYLWSDTVYSYAMCSTTECFINLTSTLSIDDLELYCRTLLRY